MSLPRLELKPQRLAHNAAAVVEACGKHGIEVFGVTKVTRAHPVVVRALVAGGVAGLADSRLENLASIRRTGYAGPLLLLRLPSPSEVAATVALADTSLNSSPEVVAALGAEARRAGKTHRVVLMVDLGDLREGVWPDRAAEVAARMAAVPGIELAGIGTNLTCFGGVVPTHANLRQLVGLAAGLRQALSLPLPVVSGGNSSAMGLIWSGRPPAGLTQLRVGEAIMLGRETVQRRPLTGLCLDVFTVRAEVIEVEHKPAVPVGELGQDAFGRAPVFADRGVRPRAILALGRQDAPPEGLTPLDAGVQILGASSDHLLVDVGDSPQPVRVGDTLSFRPDYAALLALSTSPYVETVER